jgi:hypothetical protein
MEIIFGIIIIAVVLANLCNAGYLAYNGRLYRDDISDLCQICLAQIAAVAMVYTAIGFAS